MASTAATVTPVKPAPVRPFDSPGDWQHPRMLEITQRRARYVFDEKNVKQIALNTAVLLAMLAVRSIVMINGLPTWIASAVPTLRDIIGYAFLIIMIIPVLNVVQAVMPFILPKDDYTDIPLTPKQRQLLGLPKTDKVPTPTSGIQTPPRYSRTPSIGGSPASYTSSPLSGRGSIGNSNNIGNSPASGTNNASFASNGNLLFSPTNRGSPLLMKAVGGGGNGHIRRSSFGSPGGGGLGVSTGTSLFGEGARSPSPMATPKRASIGLTNKWLYEKGRRVSGSSFQQQLRQLQESR